METEPVTKRKQTGDTEFELNPDNTISVSSVPGVRFQWRHQYEEKADEYERQQTDIVCNDPTLTQQQYKDDADLNVIVKRFGITDGAIPVPAQDPKYYGDFSDATDFRGALDRTRDALDRFDALPAEIRKQFDNDPVALYHWVSDPQNAEDAVKLGLLSKRTPEQKAAAEISAAAETPKS